MNDAEIQAYVDEIYRQKDAKPYYYQYINLGGKLGFDAWYVFHTNKNLQIPFVVKVFK